MSNILLLEQYEFTPGKTYEECLIFGGGGCILNEMELQESTDAIGNHVIKFRGKFQEAEAVNKNKRMYPRMVLETNVKRLTDPLKHGGLCGELDHPTDSIIHFGNVSHKVTNLWWENNTLMGEGQILNTPSGKILRALINDGVRIGISSRGVGNGKVNENGILVIGESYKLITFDAVADPSTHAAFQKQVASTTRRENVMPEQNPSDFQEPVFKNESRSIDTNVNEQLVLACLGSIIHKQAKEIKTRLS